MRVLIDACVLFPTILREMVIGVAAKGHFAPLWSDRILEEWRQTARRFGSNDESIAASEIALLKLQFPTALVKLRVDSNDLVLPDPGDIHVLAAAIEGGADELLTLNTKDFPSNTLAQFGILRRHPDEFLLEAFHSNPDAVQDTAGAVLERADKHGIDASNPRKLFKRARVPRLAKALFQV